MDILQDMLNKIQKENVRTQLVGGPILEVESRSVAIQLKKKKSDLSKRETAA